MAKPTENISWATDDIIDPISDQNNKVEPSALKKTNGFYYFEKPPNNWFNYWMNGVYKYISYIINEALEGVFTFVGIKTFSSIPILPNSDPTTDNQATRKKYIDDNFVFKTGSINESITGEKTYSGTLYITGIAGFNRGANIFIASNNTSQINKNSSDYICDGINDEVQIQSAIDALTAGNGGTIILTDGTFNISADIILKNNIKIIGQGSATILLKSADIYVMRPSASIDNIELSSFVIDGNKSIVTSSSKALLYDGFDYMNNSFVNNIICRNNKHVGFSNIYNINNCRALNNDNAGFSICKNVSNSISQNNLIGYSNCLGQNNNRALNNSSHGFSLCYNIGSSYSYQNTGDGFNTCSHVSGSQANTNSGNGFNSGWSISSCFSVSNTLSGFLNVSGLTSNQSISNSRYGYETCSGMVRNKSASNTLGAYLNCFADSGGAYAVADTPNGGFNG